MYRKLSDQDFIDYVKTFDIIFFNETWLASKTQYNLDIEGYKCLHIFGNKSSNTKKGRFSGGISLYYRDQFTDKIKIIEQNQTGILWIKILRDVFEFNEDVYMCNIYIPPVNSKLRNAADFDIYEQLEQGIIAYKTLGKIFITGDFNSRTSNATDLLDFDKYLDEENDFSNFSDLQIRDRVNKDHVLDTSGRRLLLLCQTSNLILANGRVLGDSNSGEFTYCSHNGLSAVDYLLLSPNDVQYLTDFKVLEFNEFSDHAPIYFTFKFRSVIENETNTTTANTTKYGDQIRFDESRVPIFRIELMNNHENLQLLVDSVNSGPVDSIVQSFTSYLYENSANVFGSKKTASYSKLKDNYPRNEWFNDDCYKSKQEFKNARNTFLKHKSDVNRQNFIQMRTAYNRVKRRAKHKFKINEGKKMSHLAKTAPKAFWKHIKKKYEKKSVQSDTLNIDECFEHFKNVYGGSTEPRHEQQTKE